MRATTFAITLSLLQIQHHISQHHIYLHYNSLAIRGVVLTRTNVAVGFFGLFM